MFKAAAAAWAVAVFFLKSSFFSKCGLSILFVFLDKKKSKERCEVPG